jgi:hypothetical protein
LRLRGQGEAVEEQNRRKEAVYKLDDFIIHGRTPG